MVKRKCLESLVATPVFSLIALCAIWIACVFFLICASGTKLYAQATDGGCKYSCTVNALKVILSNNHETRYEFDGTCAYTPWGTGACPSPRNMKGEGIWIRGYKHAVERIFGEGYGGGYYTIVTSTSDCSADPWIDNNSTCSIFELKTSYDDLKPSGGNSIKYPLSANQLTPAQRTALANQANALYRYYPAVPDILQPSAGSNYRASDKIPITVKPREMPTAGIKFMWEQKTDQTDYKRKDVSLWNKSYAADGTLTANVQLPAGMWRFCAAIDVSNGTWCEWRELTVAPALPLPPTNLKAVFPQDTTNRVILSWGSNTINAQYKVERRKKGQMYGSPLAVLNNALSYTDTNIESGKTYIYRVRLIKNNLESEPSNEVSVFTAHPVHIQK